MLLFPLARLGGASELSEPTLRLGGGLVIDRGPALLARILIFMFGHYCLKTGHAIMLFQESSVDDLQNPALFGL